MLRLHKGQPVIKTKVTCIYNKRMNAIIRSYFRINHFYNYLEHLISCGLSTALIVTNL